MGDDFKQGVYEFRTKLVRKNDELEIEYDYYQIFDTQDLKNSIKSINEMYKKQEDVKEATTTAKFSYQY